MGEESSSPASREKGMEESIVRDTLNAMHKAREVFIKNEACNKLRIALNKKVREHKLEEAVVGDEVFYKRENEPEWRGPAKVIGVSGKTVVVKHGDSLREIARVHITRIQSRSLEKEEEKTKTNNQCTGKEEPSVAVEGIMGLDTQGEEGMVMGWRERKEVEVGEEDEGTREEVEEEREEENEDERDLEEDLPKLRKGNRVRAINKDTGGREEWTVLSLAGKRSSKCWADSYNVQDS